MTNLSQHFTLEEMIRSQTATRLDISEQFAPPESIRENLKSLCENVLEPLRTKLGAPIHISSGFRCERLNQMIGGAKSSQHITGQAADIESNISAEELYKFIKDSGIKFDQCIQEFSSWVHISFSEYEQRGECLRAIKVDGKTRYIPD